MSYAEAAALEQRARALDHAAVELRGAAVRMGKVIQPYVSNARQLILAGTRGWKGPAATQYLRDVESREVLVGSARMRMEHLAGRYSAEAASLRRQAEQLRAAEDARRRAAAARRAAQRSKFSR